MLQLRDFFQLSQVDGFIQAMLDDDPALLLISGLETRPITAAPASGDFLPSGSTSIFNALIDELMTRFPELRTSIVTGNNASPRVPRHAYRRAKLSLVEPPHSYTSRIQEAFARRVGLLVIDHLDCETAPLALEGVHRGMRVVSQLDSVFWGAGVLRQVLDLGILLDKPNLSIWVLTVQRMPSLCRHCKKPLPASPAQRLAIQSFISQPGIQRYYAALPDPERMAQDNELSFYQASGCPECHGSGQGGDVAVCDIYHYRHPEILEQTVSLLPIQAYTFELARQGLLSLSSSLNFEQDQFHRTFNLLVNREQAFARTRSRLEGKLAELEAAHRVLEQRTRALFSLQDISKALIGSTSLAELSNRLCKHASELCGAERSILYYFVSPEQVEILAVGGWPSRLLHGRLPAAQLPAAPTLSEPISYSQWPPGVSPEQADIANLSLQAGLLAPLVAQQQPVGMMIVHSLQKASFLPGEVALLQTFASQAALALQRAGLVEELRMKIDQLEATQAELAKKERIEREFELARQVQQSVLPRTFPQIPGYRFAARNEPARQVGGDFYDIIWLDADHFGVAIADVSDKGMPAALYMALTRSLLLAEARRSYSPCLVLQNVNRLLLELTNASMFVTMFYGVVSRQQRQLTYARAGHDRPVLLRRGRSMSECSLQELDGPGTVLGIFNSEELNLVEKEILLLPGDRLILYTDGLIDVESPQGQLFGREKLMDLFASHQQAGLEVLCPAVFAELTHYQGSAQQYDDMTLIAIDVEN